MQPEFSAEWRVSRPGFHGPVCFCRAAASVCRISSDRACLNGNYNRGFFDDQTDGHRNAKELLPKVQPAGAWRPAKAAVLADTPDFKKHRHSVADALQYGRVNDRDKGSLCIDALSDTAPAYRCFCAIWNGRWFHGDHSLFQL